MRKSILLAASVLAGLMVQPVAAKDINLRLTAKEVSLPIDNKGTMQMSWTYEGQVPGPVHQRCCQQEFPFDRPARRPRRCREGF